MGPRPKEKVKKAQHRDLQLRQLKRRAGRLGYGPEDLLAERQEVGLFMAKSRIVFTMK
jgi:hypothetical protein